MKETKRDETEEKWEGRSSNGKVLEQNNNLQVL